MPLQLIPPGTRHPGTNKENRFFLAKGRVGGKSREFNTYTTDENTARKRAEELEASIGNDKRQRVPEGSELTFEKAAQLYIAFRNPSKFDRQCIDRVISKIGRYKIGDIRPADLHDMANELYPEATPATRNRNALRPAITILHYCYHSGLSEHWIRVKKFPEPPPVTRAVSVETAAELIEAAGAKSELPKQLKRRPSATQIDRAERYQRAKRLLVMWLFYMGNRVSAILRVEWAHIDLKRAVVVMDIRKGKSAREKALHAEIVAELEKTPRSERKGPVFPWRTRSGVRWLGDLLPGFHFTAHMGRHTHGTQLNAEGAGLRTIMESLDHSDPKSSVRYQAADVEVVRRATGKIKIKKSV